MNILDEIQKIPDYPDTPTVIRDGFNLVFSHLTNSPSFDRHIIAEALLNLADKQWHTYTKLDSETLGKIENWVVRNMDFDSVEYCDYITGIIGRLGLVIAYEKFKHQYQHSKITPSIKNAMRETIEEFGDDISDPFRSLKDL